MNPSVFACIVPRRCGGGLAAACLLAIFLFVVAPYASAGPVYPWLSGTPDPAESLAVRFPPPPGAERSPQKADSFGEWLRNLPLKPGRPPVKLYDGSLKGNQTAHLAVVDIDLLGGDLQQCADAILRLRAEYLYAKGDRGKIAFRFTSGDEASYGRWMGGLRPHVSGRKVEWRPGGAKGDSRKNFRAYLETLFMYAGTLSLERDLRAVAAKDLAPGDVIIHGGDPGHGVLVADTAIDPASGKKFFLLLQSYMPAQEIQLLRNPNDPALGPWYRADFGERLETPEWTFRPGKWKLGRFE